MHAPTVTTILVRQIAGQGPQHETQVVAASLTLVSGQQWASLCCWCLDKPENTTREAHRVMRGHGECDACSYVGRDCLVAAPV